MTRLLCPGRVGLVIVESIDVVPLCRVVAGRSDDRGDTFRSARWRTGSLGLWIFNCLVEWCSLSVELV